jgi:tRNA dimethylallyltransferase
MRHVPAIAIIGPTASGKTALALKIARQIHGEIVSCDALQVYRHMTIGTAKATTPERRSIPHHMLDLRDPCEAFSAGDYQRLARKALQEIRDREHTAIVAGGSGLYMKALLEGFFQGPGRSEELRNRMRSIVQRGGADRLYLALKRVDPEGATRVAAADVSRTIRAYEIYLLTGKPMSFWQDQPRDELKGFRWLKIGIHWPREKLYERINRRVDTMIHQGFCGEVQSLMDSYPRTCHAFKAIGYRQIADYLEGRCELVEAIEDTKRESRRYAKRQLTWFRSDPEIQWLAGDDDPDEILAHVCSIWEGFAAEAE